MSCRKFLFHLVGDFQVRVLLKIPVHDRYYVLRGSMLDEFVRQEIPCQNRLSRTEAGEPHGHLRAGGLVAVRIRCSQRGLPEPMAHLYLPLLEDVSFSRGKRDPLEEPRGQQVGLFGMSVCMICRRRECWVHNGQFPFFLFFF